jgi:hypothetical protein
MYVARMGEREMCIQSVGGETWEKEITWNSQALIKR